MTDTHTSRVSNSFISSTDSSEDVGSFRAGAEVNIPNADVDVDVAEKSSLLPLHTARRRRRWVSADLDWVPFPVKRASLVLSRRPLLALIALGTCIASLGMYFLGIGGDIDTADLSSWIYPELSVGNSSSVDSFNNSTFHFGNGSDFRIPPVNVSFMDYAWDLEEEEEEFEDDEDDDWMDNPFLPAPIRAHVALEGECLEAWVARGELCIGPGFDRLVESMEYAIPLDAVWTWVNGSDPRHRLSRAYWSKQPVEHALYTVKPPHPQTHIHPLATVHTDTDPNTHVRRADPPPAPDALANQKNGKWFRDHDELKYSMRSVSMHLFPLRTMHVLASDFRYPYHAPSPSDPDFEDIHYEEIGFTDLTETPDDATGTGRREGQWPQWIDHHMFFDQDGKGKNVSDVGVSIQHHWNLFSLPPGLHTEEDEVNWKNRVLPTFNSYAIETQIANLPGLSENFIYNNDDFFLHQPLSTADFTSPLFGPVFRMRGTSGVNPVESDSSDASGELPQMHRSAWALSERFGDRRRPYVEHNTKTYSRPLLREARLMWGEEFLRTSEHRFRGLGQDVVAVFLASHMVVERHREALLWSFIVAKGDVDGDGVLDVEEMDTLLDVITEGRVDQSVVKVLTPKRTTLVGSHAMDILDQVEFPLPWQSRYRFSSRDGYSHYRPLGEGASWPAVYSTRSTPQPLFCKIDLGQCFPEAFDGSDNVSVDLLLKRFAFEKIDCGNCLIAHLINLSGPIGNSAFLPSNDSFFPLSDDTDDLNLPSSSLSHLSHPNNTDNPQMDFLLLPRLEPLSTFASTSTSGFSKRVRRSRSPTPFLPVGPSWRPLDYTLANVQTETAWPADRSRREFAMKLIQRYSYVIADTSFEFIMMQKPVQAKKALRKVTRTNPALVCINDDIVEGRDEIDRFFAQWLNSTFPERLPFEIA